MELNDILKKDAPQVLGMMTRLGKKAFFPWAGILGQSAEAKNTEINATKGQAFEDDGSPMVIGALSKQITLPKNAFLYSPSHGQAELRNLWKEHILNKNPSVKSSITLPVVCSGLTHGLSLMGKMFVGEGRIVLPDLMWGNYRMVFDSAEFDTYECYKDNKYNLEGLKNKLDVENEQVTVILNFPHNPSGYSLTVEEAEKLAKIILDSANKGNKILVLCDDAYFGYVFDQIYPESIFSKLCNLHENILAVKIDGVTKEMFGFGLRVGFVTFGFKGMTEKTAQVLEDKTAGTIRGTISNVCTHSQRMVTNCLNKGYEDEFQQKVNIMKERYETIREAVDDEANKDYFEVLPFNSGFFMAIRLKNANANKVRQKLISDYSSGVIAIGNDVLRIAYSSASKEKLPQLIENIRKAIDEI